MIKPGLQPLDLVYSDVSRTHTTKLYGPNYYVIFLYNVTKWSETIFLKEKSSVLLVFKGYCLRNKKGEKKIQWLCTDGGGKYDSKEFAQFWEEKGIV